MVGFGYKQAWLAVRDGDPAAVIAALGLRDLGTVSWRVGGDLAYLTQDRLVLTPLLPGARGGRWLLVAGRWLLLNAGKVDIAALSATLDTEVQFFATYRVIELHRWERAIGGRTVRAFEYIGERGEVTDWRGDPDPVETAIGLPPARPEASGEALRPSSCASRSFAAATDWRRSRMSAMPDHAIASSTTIATA